jgi:hypothetical protein
MHPKKSRPSAGTPGAADCSADERRQSNPYAPLTPEIKALTGGIRIECKHELAAIDDVVNAIVALGQLRKRADRLIWDGEPVGPRELLGYLSSRMTFLKNGKSILPPWKIVLAVLARAYRGEVPVPDDEGNEQ